jgi:hypothetical protein
MMGWSMKNDRDLMQLAVANLSVDEIANRMKSDPVQSFKLNIRRAQPSVSARRIKSWTSNGGERARYLGYATWTRG